VPLRRLRRLALRDMPSLRSGTSALISRYLQCFDQRTKIMDEFTRNGNEFSVSIPLDEHGFMGRECPNEDCLGYFKVEPSTGLSGDDLQCHCPYCGVVDDPDKFWTQEQIEYAQSVALREYFKDFDKELRKIEKRPVRGAWFSIGISVESRPYPISHYAEQDLETEVVCDQCTMRYAIYGVFGYCPDCGVHNSLQILRGNCAVAKKMLDMSTDQSEPMKRALLENALQTLVASFDGFGREICRRHAERSLNPEGARRMSFQSIDKAADRVSQLFGFDMRLSAGPAEWELIKTHFQKRHLLAHTGGVVDEQYLQITGEDRGVLGRKVPLSADQVRSAIQAVSQCGESLYHNIAVVQR
jgi:hypothetical protein